ncbi:hypothetical protein ACOSQ3_027887 [Xanthoceras sorbifolium]
MATRDESGSGSQPTNQWFDAMEEKQDRMLKSIAELTASVTHSLERIEQRLVEINEREPKDRRTHGEERRSQGSRHEAAPSESMEREVIQETRRTHEVSPSPVE